MTFTVGIDIVEVDRMRKAAGDTDGMLTDLFTPTEINACSSQRHFYSRLAECFAIKEAFFKATGIGLNSGLLFRDIEVINQGSGTARLKLGERVRQLTGLADQTTCLVSSAFTDKLACAAVTLECKELSGT